MGSREGGAGGGGGERAAPAGAVPPRRGGPRPFHVTLLALITLLVVLTSTGIGVSSYFNTRAAVRGLSDRLLRELARQTAEQTRGYLEQARPVLDLARGLSRQDPACRLGAFPRGGEGAARARLFARLLRAYPQFSMLYFGDRWGTFAAAHRLPSGELRLDLRNTMLGAARLHGEEGGTLNAPWWGDWRSVRRVSGERGEALPEPPLPFDPRLRPWYRLAAERGGLAWTSPYAFARREGGARGITAALPLVGPGGETLGVFGLDVDLEALSDYVRDLPAIPEERIYLLTPSGAVVAEPGPASPAPGAAEERTTLPTAAASGDPVLRAAAARFERRGTAGPGVQTGVAAAGNRHLAASLPFTAAENLEWRVLVTVAEEVVLGAVRRNSQWTLGVCGAILLLGLGAGAVLALRITRPLRGLAVEMERIRRFEITPAALPESNILEIQGMSDAASRMKSSLRSFERYVEGDLVRLLFLTGQDARLGGETRVMTVLFCDVVNFTTISERLTPRELVEELARHLAAAETLISGRAGIVDKYIGDAVMAFWNSPLRPQADHARLACETALDYMEHRRGAPVQPGIRFEANIGIHTGEVVVGNIGSHRRMDYTVMGDAVNVASRLERLNRVYGTRVLIGEQARLAAGEAIEARLVDCVAVRGRSSGIRIYEPLGRRGEVDPGRLALRDLYEDGFRRYQEGAWDAACCRLEEALEMDAADGPSRVLLRRCREYAVTPPPEDWGGVHAFTSGQPAA